MNVTRKIARGAMGGYSLKTEDSDELRNVGNIGRTDVVSPSLMVSITRYIRNGSATYLRYRYDAERRRLPRPDSRRCESRYEL